MQDEAVTDPSGEQRLDPCPFCGGEALLNYDGGSEVWNRRWWISCKLCRASTVAHSGGNSWDASARAKAASVHAEDEAIAAWNTRRTPAQRPAASEDVVETVARAICASKDINPDCLYQHNFEGDWPEDERREYVDALTGKPRVMLFHRSWRHSEKAARAALAALSTADARAIKAEAWQPIETAPKDGSAFIAGRFTGEGKNRDGFIAVDRWSSRQNGDGWNGLGEFNEEVWPATHWMPKPPPPSPLAQQQEGER